MATNDDRFGIGGNGGPSLHDDEQQVILRQAFFDLADWSIPKRGGVSGGAFWFQLYGMAYKIPTRFSIGRAYRDFDPGQLVITTGFLVDHFQTGRDLIERYLADLVFHKFATIENIQIGQGRVRVITFCQYRERRPAMDLDALLAYFDVFGISNRTSNRISNSAENITNSIHCENTPTSEPQQYPQQYPHQSQNTVNPNTDISISNRISKSVENSENTTSCELLSTDLPHQYPQHISEERKIITTVESPTTVEPRTTPRGLFDESEMGSGIVATKRGWSWRDPKQPDIKHELTMQVVKACLRVSVSDEDLRAFVTERLSIAVSEGKIGPLTGLVRWHITNKLADWIADGKAARAKHAQLAPVQSGPRLSKTGGRKAWID